ncbi:MAG: hypothetical protein H7242_14300 [Microbacteriaceae bacterium]|nr:hypothetical protein [Burkholderiaceae bacterium]
MSYLAKGGHQHHIPLGPCLVERGSGQSVDIVWGEQGQSSANLPLEALAAAQAIGNLVLLD